jgi:putative PIN family toxin of toxin-antitoxin system
VFDVNILVSAILAPDGTPARALRLAGEQKWEIARSPHIVTKLLDVVWRPHIAGRFEPKALNAYLGEFQRISTSFVPDPTVTGIADDEEDDRVLGTAVAARADLIVTGDKRLLALRACRGIPIVSARQFLVVVEG